MQRDDVMAPQDAPLHSLSSNATTVTGEWTSLMSEGLSFPSPTGSESATISATNDPFTAITEGTATPIINILSSNYGWLVCEDELDGKEKAPESAGGEDKEGVRKHSLQRIRERGIVNLMEKGSISDPFVQSQSIQKNPPHSGVTIQGDPESPEEIPSDEEVELLGNEARSTVTPTLNPIPSRKVNDTFMSPAHC